MNEHIPKQIRPADEKADQEKRLEIRVAGKIRDFADDPRLKFHFTTIRRMGGVLGKGALSYELAKRAGIEVSENMSVRGGGAATEDRSVSIVDREKNPGDEKRDDWWIKQFSIGDNHVGFLLPDDMKLREATPQPNESLVPIRIRPEKFEGIFVTERETLYETIEFRRNKSKEKYPEVLPDGHNYGVHFLYNFWGYGLEQITALDEEIGKLDKKISAMYTKSNLWDKISKKEWPEEDREVLNSLEQERADRMERVARAELEKIVGKPAGEITERDLFIFFAKKHELPLYFVSKDFKSQKVVWPEIQVEAGE